MALRKNITSRPEELRGYNESEAGLKQVEDDKQEVSCGIRRSGYTFWRWVARGRITTQNNPVASVHY